MAGGNFEEGLKRASRKETSNQKGGRSGSETPKKRLVVANKGNRRGKTGIPTSRGRV